LDDVDCIKIDVQGSELAVFQNASRVLRGTLLIQTEVEFVELYQGQPLFADVDTFLRAGGFQFHTMNSVSGRAFKPLVANGDVNSAFRQSLWADALYVRDWMHLDNLSEAKLRNYAVLAHDVLRSYDLAHHVLLAREKRTSRNRAAQYLRRLAENNPP
jgi:IS5 family transposase